MRKIILVSAIVTAFALNAQALEIIDDVQEEQVETQLSEVEIKIPEETTAQTEPNLATIDEKGIDEWIKNGFAVNEPDKDGVTPLIYVITHNDNVEVVRHLIEAGADINKPAANGVTPLVAATSIANELRLQQIMLKSLHINNISAISEEKIAAHITSQIGRANEIIELLTDFGADVNKETPLGTPLMNAATSDWNTQIVKLLIAAGAKVNARDNNGRTALFYAHMYNSPEIEILLLKAGADTEITDRRGQTYMDVDTVDIMEE